MICLLKRLPPATTVWVRISVSAFAFLLSGSVAHACTPHHSDLSQNISFDGKQLLTDALNQSFLSEVNAHRCKHGLSELTYDSALENASLYHSNWMHQTKVFAHDSTVPNMQKPWDRAKHFGYIYSRIAENLALYARYDFGDRPFYINGICNFTNESGVKIRPIAYAALAEQVGTGWMNSAGHRANILLEDITHAAIGVAIDHTADHCGRLYVTILYGAPLR